MKTIFKVRSTQKIGIPRFSRGPSFFSSSFVTHLWTSLLMSDITVHVSLNSRSFWRALDPFQSSRGIISTFLPVTAHRRGRQPVLPYLLIKLLPNETVRRMLMWTARDKSNGVRVSRGARTLGAGIVGSLGHFEVNFVGGGPLCGFEALTLFGAASCAQRPVRSGRSFTRRLAHMCCPLCTIVFARFDAARNRRRYVASAGSFVPSLARFPRSKATVLALETGNGRLDQ